MDAELRQLRHKFQSLQKQTVSNRINERNIIEILQVIHKKKQLVDILYTSDGKAFVTWNHLRREIVDEVYAHGGRLNVVELPAVLQVDMTCIERALPQVLEERTDELTLHNGELMTQIYLDSLVAEAAENLKETGCLVVGDFAKVHQLASSFVGDLLQKAIVTKRLVAEVASGTSALYTPVYILLQLSVLRSALLARTRPIALLDVARRRDLNLSLLPSILERLAGEIPGDVEGGASGQYVPRAFTTERNQQINNIYASNGFVEYAALARLGVGAPRRFLELHYNAASSASGGIMSEPSKKSRGRGKGRPSQANESNSSHDAMVRASADFPLAGHSLTNVFLADKLLSRIAADAEELLSGDMKYFDLREHLPAAVDLESDVEVLLKRIFELEPALSDCLVLRSRVLVMRPLIGQSMVGLTDVVSSEVRRFKQKPSTQPTKAAPGSSSGRRGNTKAVDDAPALAAGGLAECVMGSKSLLSFMGNILGGPFTAFTQHEERHEELLDLIQQLREEITTIAQTVAENQAQSELIERKKQRLEHQKKCADAWCELCVILRGLDWADRELEGSDAAAIHRVVLQTRCSQLFRDVLINEAQDFPVDRLETLLGILGGNNLKPAIALFDKKKAPALNGVVDALSDKSAAKFADALELLCTSGEISLGCFHALNKKVERDIAAALRQQLIDDVRGSTFTAGVDATRAGSLFSRSLSAFLASTYRVVVHLPGKAVAGVCSRIQRDEAVSASTKALVAACRDIVVASLSHGSITEADAAELEPWRQLVCGEANHVRDN